MSDLSEFALDRHFASQLRNLQSYSKEHPVSQEDHDISQRWMQQFQEAKGLDKFARNCMLLMMFNQLRDIGHLSKPFTELANLSRSMDDLLNEYNGTTAVEEEQQQQPPPAVDDVQDAETNVSNYGSSRLSQEMTPMHPISIPEFESIKLANQDLLKEIDSLHSRTVETEKLFISKNQVLERQMVGKSVVPKSELVQENIYQACRAAIDLLKNWQGESERLNFLATCLEPILRNDVPTSLQISELDISLENTLNGMVTQACSRRDDNVRMLYDHILRHDKNDLKEKKDKLRRLQDSMRLERQRLLVLAEDLKRREDLIWRHQALATIAITGLSSEEQRSPSDSKCKSCSKEKSVGKGLLDPFSRSSNVVTAKSVVDLEKLSDELSDLSIDKW
ncbi:uncharacterized protein LOC6544396 [Drosophila erecta]|uniref:DUF4485 domain-containing protein n=1 Tax=Drosophila erecta TaxID=7220 RepID=B3NFW1_DROER|nr:uncharacterized protein LOC6544396 [Drosophila erecta]EDV50723.1 uncharacterized protein Dere_GG15102 [Drosophila erecta]